MLNEICAEIKNYFTRDEDRHIGDFSIIGGEITPSVSILDGQYYRIIGSVFNDGVHGSSDVLVDEPEFHGAVWCMRVPNDIIELANKIEEWNTKNADAIGRPFASESFGGYSYSIAGSSDGTTGASWKNVGEFKSVLNHYRRLRVL